MASTAHDLGPERVWIAAKLHGLTVTGASVDYNGSVTIDERLLAEVGVAAFEQVHVVNLANGNRWVTYVLPGPPGVFELNGGGAHLGRIGDRCIAMTYRPGRRFTGAPVVFLDETNQVIRRTRYP